MWPAIIGAVGSLIGGGVSALGQSRAQDRSEGFSREMYEYALRNGPSLEMEGLRKAGINPMLRYGTGGQGTPVSMPTMSFGNSFGELGSAIGGAASSAFSLETAAQGLDESKQRVAHSQTDMLKMAEETRRIVADTSLTQAQRENALAENGRILQQTAVGIAEEYLRYAQANLSDAQASQAGAMVGLLSEQRNTEMFRADAVRWQAALTQAQTEAANYGLTREGIDARIYRSALGIWLRETTLMRDATGASGVLGVGQAALNSVLEGIESLFE